MGNQGRISPLWLSRPISFWRTKPPPLLLATVTISGNIGTNCPKPRTGDDGRELSYTPCLLLKPAPYLRLALPQIQPCFPAASNALARPGGNRIFAPTPTERITHYTLQAKSCAKRGVAPFGYPHKKRRYATPLRGAYRLFLLLAARFTVCPFVSLSIMFPPSYLI